ncbi:MAG: PHP domain-containing protein [Desulfovibrionaceae bacterium]|nr:PHP domain-containing protein [Desulfovibrionaceae bacterium]
MSIDLHTHSTYSDGTDSPEELLAKAKERGIEALALTDHDTCRGLARAAQAAKEHNIIFVRGCELSTMSERGEFHILGLWIPEECPALKIKLRELRRRRDLRNEQMVERLCAIGLPLTIEDVLACVQGNGTVGRPHIAQAMLNKGYVRTTREAFDKYIGAGCSAYVPKKVFSPEEAVKALVEVQATICLAHPMLHHYPLHWLKQRIAKLVDCGLDTIEVWHTEHSLSDIELCLQWAKEFNIGVSGGSDYHAKRKPGVELGTGHGNLNIPMSVLDALIARRKAKGLPVF